MERIGSAGLRQFLRFCVVGAVGFVVDAGVLLAVLRVFEVGPIKGRLISFLVAVLTTFELNRRWAFRTKRRLPYHRALASYLGVQGFGFCCNFGVYTLLYLSLPPSYKYPLLCLTIASVLALLVNYTGANLVVFRSERSAAGPADPGAATARPGPAADAERQAAGADGDRPVERPVGIAAAPSRRGVS